jgi:uncharacterized phiE125 gp8 family phage protein
VRLSLITGPTAEPLTLDEAKDHLRVTFDREDALISRLIVGAREAFERETGRQLLTATWRGFLDCFPQFDAQPIELAKPPLATVNAVTYLDTSGVPQAWPAAEYTVDAFAGPFAKRGMLYPKAEATYPSSRRIPNAVTIEFDAGYGDASDVPDEIKQSLFVWVGHHYEFRELVIVGQTPAVIPALGFEPWKEMDFG